MNTAYAPSRGLFAAYLALTFYCLAAALLAEWQDYHSWADAGSALSAADLAAWNMADSARPTLPFTLPAVLLTLVVLALVWRRPPAVPRGALWAVLACHVAAWSIFLLGFGWSAAWLGQHEMINLLVHSDWVRKLLLLIEVPMALYMAYRVYGPAVAARPRPARLSPARNTPAIG